MTGGDKWQFGEEWVQQSPMREPSAAERDAAARRRRWAQQDAADQRAAAQHRAILTKANRRARWRRVYPWLIFATVAVVLIAGSRMLGLSGTPFASGSDSAPPPGLGEQPNRILPAVTAAATGSAFTISQHNPDGTPVTFSPCRTWPVVVNTAHALKHAYQQVVDTVTTVSAATGLAFTVESATDERAAEDRAA